jgi:hypothetical protein
MGHRAEIPDLLLDPLKEACVAHVHPDHEHRARPVTAKRPLADDEGDDYPPPAVSEGKALVPHAGERFTNCVSVKQRIRTNSAAERTLNCAATETCAATRCRTI